MITEILSLEADNSPADSEDEKSLNKETEILLLNELNDFEKRHGYNKKGIALGKMASEMNTNTKYLSTTIKKNKADNFSNYINMLRTNYIVDKIENVAEYRKYKVSYLTEETGFSSANAFSKVFKDVTGVSPSSYIALLSEAAFNKSA